MKKFLIFVGLVVVGISYAYTHYTPQDAFDYAQAKADKVWTPRVEYYVGYYLVIKERNEDAIKDLEQLLNDWPDSPYTAEATFHLGEAYEATRQKDKAKELYEKYLELSPNGQNSELAKRKIEIFKSQ